MGKMSRATIFITGTSTGVGKTVLTTLLTAYWRQTGVPVAALKPVCSGGREDAEWLAHAMGGELALDEMNPWHFRAAVAPVLAARSEGRRVVLAEILAHVRAMRRRFAVVLIEGAGGLLSPLGERVDSRDLIVDLRAVPVIVAPNELGVVNQVRLTLAALPLTVRRLAVVVLMDPVRTDASTRTNADLLGEYFDRGRIWLFPRVPQPLDLPGALKNRRVRETLAGIIAHCQ